MKLGSAPTPPDDEAPDALLATLRQHLGAYGQAPPPGAWAAIRRRVSPPPPPQWRRPRRLLPLLALLAGLLLVSMPTGRVGWRWVAGPAAPAGRRSTAYPATSRAATEAVKAPVSDRSASRAGRTPKLAATAAISQKSLASSRLPTVPKSTLGVGTAARPAGQKVLGCASTTGELAAQKRSLPIAHRAAALLATGRPVASRLPESGAGRAPQRASAAALAAAARNRARTATTALTQNQRLKSDRPTRPIPLSASGTAHVTANQLASNSQVALPNAVRALASQRRSRLGQVARRPSVPSGANNLLADSLAGTASGARFRSPNISNTQLSQPVAPRAAEQRPPLGLLAPAQPGLLVPGAAWPPVLAARPDSAPPPLLARRWSVLVVAGPTLSYRTLGPAPTLAASHPDFARLERPALGLGAQAQVRRVLSGRWALAVGVGYHEYATRLALAKDSLRLHQRDTYRLLTVPVQLTYALGAPRGRLTKGLLLGAEPGWYVGGRSTEGAGCGCEQQAYSSAATSPYRAWSLAFSLGLDLRYRLGKPDSRWQWLVQPTGRYVATLFVRSDAVGFTQRQPFSLGVFTGFSWDVR